MRRQVSPELVDWWLAYDEIEPLGPEKFQPMLALHGANLAAALGRDIPPTCFYPDNENQDAGDELMSEDEMAAKLAAAAARRRTL